jgi:protease PrsW
MGLYIFSFIISIAFWLWIIMKYDRFEREPLKTILFVFIVGGLISVIPAGSLNLLCAFFLNYHQETANTISSINEKLLLLMGFVGINEEFWKALVTVILVRKMKNFNEPADALVYSMTVAFGFSVFENIDYSLKLGLPGFILRQFNAVPLHIGLAAIWGTGIAKAKFINKGKYFTALLPYILVAALLHSAYNLAVILITSPILRITIPSVIAFFLIRHAIRKVGIYALEGPFSNALICHACKTSSPVDAKLCHNCGEEIKPEFYDLCGRCNAKVSRDAEFCPSCGTELKA